MLSEPVPLHTLHVSCFDSYRLSLSCCTHCMYPVLLLIDCPCPVAHIACILFCFLSTVPLLLHTLHVSCFAFYRLSLSCCTHCMYPVLLLIDCPCPVAHIACILFCFLSTVPVLLHTLHVSCFASHRLSLSCCTHYMYPVLLPINCPCPVAHITCILFCFSSTVPVLLHTLHVSCFAFHRLSLSCCTHYMYPVFLFIDCPCPVAHIACILFCFLSAVPVLLHTLHVSCFASHRLFLPLLCQLAFHMFVFPLCYLLICTIYIAKHFCFCPRASVPCCLQNFQPPKLKLCFVLYLLRTSCLYGIQKFYCCIYVII